MDKKINSNKAPRKHSADKEKKCNVLPVNMRTITSSSGKEEAVTARRSESSDAPGIDRLMGPSARVVFGRVRALQLLEKANLAVTLANRRDDVVAHASFFDHPIAGLVDQAQWETFLKENFAAQQCTPLNTLFLHLFVAQSSFAAASVKEIMRAAFKAITELDFICLLSPNTGVLEPALKETFKPLQRLSHPGPQGSAYICYRGQHWPSLYIRPARVEDHGAIMSLFEEPTNPRLADELSGPTLRKELAGVQQQHSHMAVCESSTVVVGFISISCELGSKLLRDFDLTDFDVWKKRTNEDKAAEWDLAGPQQQEAARSRSRSPPDESSLFHIQLFVIDKDHEMSSTDFLPYLFSLFPERHLCIVRVPAASPELQLLHSFTRLPSRGSVRERYVCPRSTLSRRVEVRWAQSADRLAISELLTGLSQAEDVLQDLDRYCEMGRDLEGAVLQALVLQVEHLLVGILIMKEEEELAYIRAHFNIENFIYFSQHCCEEHAQMRHCVLRLPFQHLTRHLLKEAFRLAHKSCLYFRKHPSPHSPENSCVHPLDAVLNCMVPVRPRRQIIYPLEELGTNIPSSQITEYQRVIVVDMSPQAPFALSLSSRKLSLELKLVVNSRVVVVGASDTALAFLRVLCSCAHLKFNNLTLISTHGFCREHTHEYAGFLATSHAHVSRDLAQLPLHPAVTMVTGKMVGINRKSKRVHVSGGGTVSYEYLVLSTGLQYQVPCPTGVDLSQPITSSQLQGQPRHRHTGPTPSNLFTLNDPVDCMAARTWLCEHFVDGQDNAIVYGNGINVFTTVETLQEMGIQGARIHVALTPPPPATACFSDLQVEKAVMAALEKAGVQVYQDCLLAQLNKGEPQLQQLTSASFTTSSQPLHLQCGVFVNLSTRGVDYDAFESIRNCFLVFDHRLVINNAFRTSDPAIFGAGPLTKFSLRYHSDEWSHDSFNSREVGEELAAVMLPLFDPTAEVVEPSAELERLVPQYNQANIQGGKLPGGFHYLHFSKPTSSNPAAPAANQDGDIVTGAAETGNYFSLRLDAYKRVETLTCLSRMPLPVSNYLCLYGKHEQLLGQLISSYKQALITDLYSFFKQNWCLAIYHDRFSDFEQELQQITLAPSRRAAVLRQRAVQYLTFNRNLLPMFPSPDQL